MPNLTAALPAFVITLREGVEATLVVGIVLAYLKKIERTELNAWVAGGVGLGLLASALVGLTFALVFQTLGSANALYGPVVKPLLEGVFGVVAIALLSWMLVWMTRQARQMKAQVEGAVQSSLGTDGAAGWGLLGLIFFAVAREGFETVVFLAAQFQQGWLPLLGAIAGLLSAIGVGVLLFQLGVKINLRRFFQVLGLFLLLIVAGLVVSVLHNFDVALLRWVALAPSRAAVCLWPAAAGASCLLGPLVWNTHALLPDRQFPGLVLHTLFGYTDHLFALQALGYGVFLGAIGGSYFRSLNATASPPPGKPTPASTTE